MSTKAEYLRQLANHAQTDQWDQTVAAELRSYADSLDAVAVSDETALAVLTKYNDALPEGIEDVWPGERSVEIRVKCMCAALESILPIADEQARDAERYRWLRDLSISMLCVRADRWNGMHNVRMIGSELDEAIDRSIASAKGDAR